MMMSEGMNDGFSNFSYCAKFPLGKEAVANNVCARTYFSGDVFQSDFIRVK
jgi:hypothetical protein